VGAGWSEANGTAIDGRHVAGRSKGHSEINFRTRETCTLGLGEIGKGRRRVPLRTPWWRWTPESRIAWAGCRRRLDIAAGFDGASRKDRSTRTNRDADQNRHAGKPVAWRCRDGDDGSRSRGTIWNPWGRWCRTGSCARRIHHRSKLVGGHLTTMPANGVAGTRRRPWRRRSGSARDVRPLERGSGSSRRPTA